MALESGQDKGGQLVWKNPDDSIVPVRIMVDSGGSLVPVPSGPGSTEAKQDDIIDRTGEKQSTPSSFTILRRLKDLLSLIVLAAGNAIIGKVKLVDDSGNVIGSLHNSLNVHSADAHRIGLNLHAINPTGVSETFGVGGALAGDSIFDVAVGQGGTFSANDHITVKEGITHQEINSLKIISISTDTLTVDRPLERSYTAAGIIEIVETDVSTANGTVASPIDFEIAPPGGDNPIIYHINTMLLHYEDEANPGIELFSGIAALPNGLVIRSETDEDGNNNHVVLRTNGDKGEYFAGNEVVKVQRVGGGDFAIDSIWHYSEHTGAIIRLDGAQGDKLIFRYQDNMTAITTGENIVQGHLEG